MALFAPTVGAHSVRFEAKAVVHGRFRAIRAWLGPMSALRQKRTLLHDKLSAQSSECATTFLDSSLGIAN